MKGSNSKPEALDIENFDGTEWELKAGGMLVQKKMDEIDSTFPQIKIKIYHDNSQHDVNVPSNSTFGELKRVIAQVIGLAPEEQRLLFRGKKKDDHEHLHMAGVKDMSNVVVLEDPASRERKIAEMRRCQGIEKACEAVAGVRNEVDKLVEKVNALETTVHGGANVADQEFVVLSELLMMQLLKLDGIEAEGEARLQRRTEVRRIQQYVEMLDALKVVGKNPIPSNNNSKGMRSLTPPPANPFTKTTDEWEKFD